MSCLKKIRQVYLVDEAIIKGYNQCIAASELSAEDIIAINDHLAASTKPKTKVIRFHKWLIATINNDFPYVKILHICDKER